MNRETRRALMAGLENDAQRICARFGLCYRALEPERANVKRRYGVCFSDGTIRIRLRHATTGQPLKYSSLVNTLCHELAHLRHFNHGQRFQGFYGQILEWARREGIYRPGSQRGTAPTSGPPALFGPSESPGPPAQTPFLRPDSRPTVHDPSASTASPTRRPRPPIPGQLELFG
ncbi:MAG: M48 family metallopeptidase [Deltaproteobacteria bacterium]|nr:M48 family metallopeptidase [Deltaproteobacteria bacterium]